MTELDHVGGEDLRRIVGERLPAEYIPAAWWTSTDPGTVRAYDRWKTDYDNHFAKVRELSDRLGVEECRVNSFAGSTVITGFVATRSMTYWSGHPDYVPPPDGWRVDSKTKALVPVRRTKKDRDSDANRAFSLIARVPDVCTYLKGLPTEIWIPTHDGSGSVRGYGMNYLRGEACIVAMCSGDPDRIAPADRRQFTCDGALWSRQPLAAYHQILSRGE